MKVKKPKFVYKNLYLWTDDELVKSINFILQWQWLTIAFTRKQSLLTNSEWKMNFSLKMSLSIKRFTKESNKYKSDYRYTLTKIFLCSGFKVDWSFHQWLKISIVLDVEKRHNSKIDNLQCRDWRVLHYLYFFIVYFI